VCDMSPCYISFGRPWEFENYVVYDGDANTILMKTGSVEPLLKCKSFLDISKPGTSSFGSSIFVG